ncbi:MAG: hypothetical protein ACK528_12170, partial [Alphaproteobacteria bacterium]
MTLFRNLDIGMIQAAQAFVTKRVAGFWEISPRRSTPPDPGTLHEDNRKHTSPLLALSRCKSIACSQIRPVLPNRITRRFGNIRQNASDSAAFTIDN